MGEETKKLLVTGKHRSSPQMGHRAFICDTG